MEVLTASQMRRADRDAIDRLGIESLLLMEAAGSAVARAILADWPDAGRRGVLIACGKGNNGGDGLVVARHLATAGVRSRVLLFTRGDALEGDPRTQLRAARGAGIEVVEIPDEDAWRRHAGSLRPPMLVVDALLGTGVQGGARGLLATVIEDLNASGVEVASIDLPSGLDADRARPPASCVRARRTYTLCRPKLPLAAGMADVVCGRWTVVPIGIPDESVARAEPHLTWFDHDEARALLAPRRADAHKGTFGHLLVVAGAAGAAGAAALVGEGALRSGCGLVTVGSPASVRAEVASHRPELMTAALPDDGGTLAGDADDDIRALAARRDALAIGPGLGTGDATAESVVRVLTGADAPTVADADALNVLASRGSALLSRIGGAGVRVLTPHPGEAARLLGTTAEDVQADRTGAAGELARQSASIVVLKGHRTVVARPDGALSFNATGNPAMATAGSGDVLTGVVGALLARGLDAWDAARLAVWAHGRAGDIAAAEIGPAGIVARDIADRLPGAFAPARRPDAPGDPVAR